MLEVVIDSSGGYKFIVATATDRNGKTQTIVRANEKCNKHRGILTLLEKEAAPLGLTVRCIGGGNISVKPEAKTIQIWGSSGDFGREPNRQQTVSMLRVAFPEFRVSCEY